MPSEPETPPSKSLKAIDVTKAKRFTPYDPSVLAFVDHLMRSDFEFYRHYLVWQVLNHQLSKFMGHSPIISGDAIHLTLSGKAVAFLKEGNISLNGVERGWFIEALQRRLYLDRHAEQHMKLLFDDGTSSLSE